MASRLHRAGDGPTSRGEIDLAMALAGPLALSLANTQLYTQVSRSACGRATALLSVGRALSQPGSRRTT